MDWASEEDVYSPFDSKYKDTLHSATSIETGQRCKTQLRWQRQKRFARKNLKIRRVTLPTQQTPIRRDSRGDRNTINSFKANPTLECQPVSIHGPSGGYDLGHKTIARELRLDLLNEHPPQCRKAYAPC